MATYVSNNVRAFKAPGDPCDLPLNCTSIFHMKTYKSATDSRAWAFGSQDRKQYILELFAAENTKPVEMYKYVNVQALMRTLLSNKDADIYYLQSQLKILEAFIDDIPLNDTQRRTLECLKRHPFQRIWSQKSKEKELTVNYITPSDHSLATSHNEIIYELRRKIQEQEQQLNEQKAIACDARHQLATLQQLADELDNFKEQNVTLQRSMTTLRNTKASSNNDLLLKAQISELKLHVRRKEAQKLSNLKLTRSDQVTIFPTIKSTHEVGAITSQTYIDVAKIIEERNILQDTVQKLLAQMEHLHRLNNLIEKHLPERNNRMAGDHVTQVCQTLPHLQAEHELKLEIDRLKGQLSKFEIKNLEFNSLCLRISELQLVQKEHEEMKVKYNLQFLEQRTSMCQNLRQIDCLKEQCVRYMGEIERYKKYEEENDILSDRCRNLQSIIESQQSKTRYLENGKTVELESESKIKELQEELQRKTNIIQISDAKLVGLQAQLRDSINNLTYQTTVLKNSLQEAQNRVAELLKQDIQSQSTIKNLHEEISYKDSLIRAMEQEKLKTTAIPKVLQERDYMIEHLRAKLLELQRDNDKLGIMTSRLHCYIMSTSCSSTSTVNNNYTGLEVGTGRCIDNLYQSMRQLQVDLAHAKTSCDVSNFYRMQSKYKELQSLAKEQVHWLATELRKCKQEVQFLQCQMKQNK